MNGIRFTVLGHPQPQGSTRAFVVRGKAHVTSDNPALAPWRQQLGWAALRARSHAGCHQVFAAHPVPVRLSASFFFAPPARQPKARILPTVRPDLDKLCRSTLDALSGILWCDDAQVVALAVEKHYGLPERAEVSVETVESNHERKAAHSPAPAQ